jgi:hypothetical protein
MRLRFTAAIGAIAVLVGLAISFQQGLASAIPASWAFVLVIAVVAGVQTIRTAFSRRRTPIQAAETGDPERRYEAPTPGDDLAETIALSRQRTRGTDRPRDRVRRRVATAAAAAVADAEGCSLEEAGERVRTGEWTEDPVAAWFLGEAVGLAPAERARLLASAPFSQFEASFDRTVREVERLSGGGR